MDIQEFQARVELITDFSSVSEDGHSDRATVSKFCRVSHDSNWDDESLADRVFVLFVCNGFGKYHGEKFKLEASELLETVLRPIFPSATIKWLNTRTRHTLDLSDEPDLCDYIPASSRHEPCLVMNEADVALFLTLLS